jgi:hypothetical protein
MFRILWDDKSGNAVSDPVLENEEILFIRAELSLLKSRRMFKRWRKMRYCWDFLISPERSESYPRPQRAKSLDSRSVSALTNADPNHNLGFSYVPYWICTAKDSRLPRNFFPRIT